MLYISLLCFSTTRPMEKEEMMVVMTIIAGTVVLKVQLQFHCTTFKLLIPVFKFISCFLTGETGDAHIKSLRVRQMKNFHLALMISQVKVLPT